jgi:hypothetical protein
VIIKTYGGVMVPEQALTRDVQDAEDLVGNLCANAWC